MEFSFCNTSTGAFFLVDCEIEHASSGCTNAVCCGCLLIVHLLCVSRAICGVSEIFDELACSVSTNFD